jgi:hypothetical protein
MNTTKYPKTGGWSSSTLVNERNKLQAKESDWNVAGVSTVLPSRTRHSGQGRPSQQYLNQNEAYCSPVKVVNLESSDSEYLGGRNLVIFRG